MEESREIAYDDNPEFNEDIDQLHPGFTTSNGEAHLSASWMLYNTDYEIYIQELDLFNEKVFQDIVQNIQDKFPSVIAYNFRLSERGEGAEDPVRKLLHLKDTWEAVIFVLYAATFGEIRKKGIDCKSAQILKQLDTNGTPIYTSFNTSYLLSNALKTKIKNIRAIVTFSKANELNLKCEAISIELLEDLLKLQDIRNDISHHAAPTKEQAKEELNIVLPLFESMIKKLDFLKDFRILRFNNYSEQCRCEVFEGHSLNKEFDTLILVGDNLSYVLSLGQEQLFIEWGSDYFSISPFLHYTVDETGHESYLCFYKGKRHGLFLYEPVKVRTEQAYDSLQGRFNNEKEELLNLLVP